MSNEYKQPGTMPSFSDSTRTERPEDNLFRGPQDDFAQRPSTIDADRLKKDGVALKDKAIDRLTTEADSRKDVVSQQLKSVSSALGAAEDGLSEQGSESPEWLKSGLRQAAKTVEQLADRVQNKGSAELIGDVKSFAQNNPGTFLMACAAVGFAAARVFKASETDSAQPDRAQPGPGEAFATRNQL